MVFVSRNLQTEQPYKFPGKSPWRLSGSGVTILTPSPRGSGPTDPAETTLQAPRREEKTMTEVNPGVMDV